MNTDRLAYFLAVAREGSFSAAARTMYVSQTAISQQIAALEKQLNTPLFHRLSKGAELTEAGTRFLSYAERMLSIELQVKDAFANKQHNNIVRIGYNGPLEKEMIVDMYLDLHSKMPNLIIQPTYLSLSAMSDALYRGECDVMITLPGTIQQKDIYQQVITKLPMVAAVSSASQLAAHDLLTIEMLNQYPLILLATDQAKNIHHTISDWAKQLGFNEESIIYADSTDVQILMISVNLGVSFLPNKNASFLKGVKLIPLADEVGQHQAVLAARKLTPTIRAIRNSLLNITARP